MGLDKQWSPIRLIPQTLTTARTPSRSPIRVAGVPALEPTSATSQEPISREPDWKQSWDSNPGPLAWDVGAIPNASSHVMPPNQKTQTCLFRAHVCTHTSQPISLGRPQAATLGTILTAAGHSITATSQGLPWPQAGGRKPEPGLQGGLNHWDRHLLLDMPVDRRAIEARWDWGCARTTGIHAHRPHLLLLDETSGEDSQDTG